MDSSTATAHNLEDYSASSTTLTFDQPIPLLRGAVPSNDPKLGPYVLAFKSTDSWTAAYHHCESLITDQCQEGARIGCAVTASNKCRPPWWRILIGPNLEEMKEREKCEVREMETCFAVAKSKCEGFAREKCWKPFSQAKIVSAAGMVRGEEIGLGSGEE